MMTDLTDDLGPTLWAINSVFAVVATATVLARFAARKVRRMGLGADDWIICIALALNWAMYALAARAEIHGMGKHIETLTHEQLISFTKNLYYMQITYVPAPPAVKLSLLFLYRRIFQYTGTRSLWFVYGMMAVIMIWCTINLFLVIFFCTPISALWTGEGKCLDLDPYSYAVINVLTTLIVWAMPIPRVWKLRLPRTQKVALSLVFALGLFDCSTAIGRVILMPDKNEQDKTWYYAKPSMMHIIEVSTGIVCACLPIMRLSIKEAFSSSSSSSSNGRRNCFGLGLGFGFGFGFGSCCLCSGLCCAKSNKFGSSSNGQIQSQGQGDYDNRRSTPVLRQGLGFGLGFGRARGGNPDHHGAGTNTNSSAGKTKAKFNEDLDWTRRPSDGCHTEITRCSGVGDDRWVELEGGGSRQILVTEEIDVELRAIDRVAGREAVRSSNS